MGTFASLEIYFFGLLLVERIRGIVANKLGRAHGVKCIKRGEILSLRGY